MIQRFLERPCFTCRWVLQEIWNAVEGKVLLGSLEVTWRQLRNACAECLLPGTVPLRIERIRTSSERVTETGIGGSGKAISLPGMPGRRNILHHLRLFNELQCKDPRDRIGALLGLQHTFDKPTNFRIDCRLSREENYINFATYLINTVYHEQVLQEALDRQDQYERICALVYHPGCQRGIVR
jgi:hypothetical protein